MVADKEAVEEGAPPFLRDEAGASESLEAYFDRFIELCNLETIAAEERSVELTQQTTARWLARGSKKVTAAFHVQVSEAWEPREDDYVLLEFEENAPPISSRVTASDLVAGSVTVLFRRPFVSRDLKPWDDMRVHSTLVRVRPAPEVTNITRWRRALSTFVQRGAPPGSLPSVILGTSPAQRIYSRVAPTSRMLTKSQQQCIDEALNRNLTIIQGPPGTGKTTVALHILKCLVSRRLQKEMRILVTAPSNAAVDLLATKLHEAGLRVLRPRGRRADAPTELLKGLTLEHAMERYYESESVNDRMKELMEKLRTESISKDEHQELSSNMSIARREACLDADVICTTNSLSSTLGHLAVPFNFVIVDEAAQATELETLLPFTVSCNCSQFVLIGDHQQLRPQLLSWKATQLKLGVSMFERLLKSGNPAFMLSTQFRMHPEICAFPSQLFYASKLETHKSVYDRKASNIPWLVDNVPVIVVHCKGEEERVGMSSRNVREATEVLSILQRLKRLRVAKECVRVITPYKAQQQYILDRIATLMKTDDIQVSSVDSMQGLEADYIVLSTVRSNDRNDVGFLNDRRRFNVAMTRARLGVFVVCNVQTISATWTWHAFLSYFFRNILLPEDY